MLFQLASLTKKCKVGAPLKECFFRAFLDDDNLCVVQCLRQYEKVTKPLRQTSTNAQPLFLSYIKLHKPVTLFTEIGTLDQGAGIDTGVFKAHSVRGASTSAPMRKEVHISDILQTADCSKDSTFKRFYYRPVAEVSYAELTLE